MPGAAVPKVRSGPLLSLTEPGGHLLFQVPRDLHEISNPVYSDRGWCAWVSVTPENVAVLQMGNRCERELIPTDQSPDLRNAAKKPDNSPECSEKNSGLEGTFSTIMY